MINHKKKPNQMKNIFILFLLLIINQTIGQSIYGELKPVTKDELEMTTYEKDKEAEAVVLYDYGETFFQPTTEWFDIVFLRTTRIKILTEEGIDYAKVVIPRYYENDKEEVISNIKARAYNLENGMIIKTELDPDQIYEEVYNKYTKLIKFAIPNVKVGTIIEYSYTQTSQFYYRLEDWEFQHKIPTIHSEYQVKLTPYYSYKWILQGANKFYSKKSQKASGLENNIFGVKYKEMIHNYVMKDIPAFRDDNFISNEDDYIIKMDWQLTKYSNNLRGIEYDLQSTWGKIVTDYLKSDVFGKYISKSNKKAAKLIDISAIKKLPENERVNAIIDYVKQNYKWDGYDTELALKTPNEFLKDKSGAVSDINLFTIGLLNAAGIDAYGVISSTRYHGRIYYDYAFTHFFNYVVIYAKINGEFQLYDATQNYLSNTLIPQKCINGKGLLIKKGEVEWIPIKSTTTSESIRKFNLSFTKNESIAKNTFEWTGYRAAEYREIVKDEGFDLREDIMDDEGLVEESVKITNQDDKEANIKIEFETRQELSLKNDKLYISPFLEEVLDENHFKAKTRDYPIDFIYPFKYTYISTIEIPEGYVVDYLKKDFNNVDNDYYTLKYTATENEGELVVELSYEIKKNKYPSNAYGRLKYFYSQIIKLGQEKVVFKKIE